MDFETTIIEHKTRSRSEPIDERYPGWLSTETIKSPNTAVVIHLPQFVYTVNVKQDFRPQYNDRGQQSVLANCSVLSLVKSDMTRFRNPPQWVQKKLIVAIQTLGLPPIQVQTLDQTFFALCIEYWWNTFSSIFLSDQLNEKDFLLCVMI